MSFMPTKEDKIANFKQNNKELTTMLEELKKLPWHSFILNSLWQYVEAKGELTEKQRSLVTKLYLECCITSDSKIEEQREMRRLLYQLRTADVGRKDMNFISSLLLFSERRPLTYRQVEVTKKMAKRYMKKMKEIDFDGWFSVPKTGIDTGSGICYTT